MVFEVPRYSEEVFHLFRKLVNQPYQNHEETDAWIYEVLETDSEYHRLEILKQGTADFSKGFNGLTSDDLVLLYCNYYMQMHTASGYYVFSKGKVLFNEYLLETRRNIVFIDFGCGPLTSGVALAWYYLQLQNSSNPQKLQFDYLGIDSCGCMLSKAQQVSRDREIFDVTECRFDFRANLQDYEGILNWINAAILRHQTHKYLIILNFAYFFASETINVEQLVQVIKGIIERYGDEHKICILFQNPPVPRLNRKWDKFKKQFNFINLIDGEEQIRYRNTTSAYNENGCFSYKLINLKYEILIHEPDKYLMKEEKLI